MEHEASMEDGGGLAEPGARSVFQRRVCGWGQREAGPRRGVKGGGKLGRGWAEGKPKREERLKQDRRKEGPEKNKGLKGDHLGRSRKEV